VVSVFGRDLAAVGFSLSLNLCMTALRRQDKELLQIHVDTIIGYSNEPGMRRLALEMAKELRADGLIALVDCEGMNEEDLSCFAENRGIEQMVFLNDGMCDCEEEGK